MKCTWSMVTKLYTCVLSAFQFRSVLVETDLSPQLPSFQLVGLASSMTQESRERVRAAVCNSGYEWPGRKITINLVTEDLPKWGSSYELPMAMSIVLSAWDQKEVWPRFFAFGELSLSGEIRPSRVGPALRQWLKKELKSSSRYDLLIGHPEDLGNYLDWGTSAQVFSVTTLKDAITQMLPFLKKWTGSQDSPTVRDMQQTKDSKATKSLALLESVEGEPLAVLAALVALTWDRHHLLLAGPHGVGKSMIARAISEAQGSVDQTEYIERTFIEQALGMDRSGIQKRPAVFLQSTMTRAALEGSVLKNGQALPGELSRAHGGLLVMDEFLEFRRDVLECLRQPMEEGCIRLQRAQYRAQLPARFQLIATTNLCPCGHWGSLRQRCRCRDMALQSYHRKLSGPLLDRFDLIVVLGGGENWLKIVQTEKLRALVKRLIDPRDWEERLTDARQVAMSLVSSNSDLAIHQELNSANVSRRGRAKIAAVTRTLALLDGQTKGGLLSAESAVLYRALAISLRGDMEKIINNNSLYKLEYNSVSSDIIGGVGIDEKRVVVL